MLTLTRSIVSRLGRGFRSRAVVELENLALRHQLHVLRRQRPGRLRLFTFDRLLWVSLPKTPKFVEKSGDLFRSAVMSPACSHFSRNSSHGSPVGFAAA